MKPSFLDNLGPEDFIQPDPDPKKTEKRNETFPLISMTEEKIGKYVMRFPKRFHKLWVIKPNAEFLDYSNRFMIEPRTRFKNEIFRSNKTNANGHLIPDRPYNWFYDVFMGNDSMEPLFGRLTLENKSGEQDFDYSLVDKVLTHGDIHLVDLWCCHTDIRMIFANKDLPLWLTFLKSQIPAALVSEQEMEKNAPSIIKGLVKRNPDDTIENLSEVMEALGCYLPGEGTIILCPNRIRKVAKDLGIDPNILFCIVYVHELAHAAMDQSIEVIETENNPDYEYSIAKVDCAYTHDESSNFMEESLANMVMLKYLEWYSEIEEDGTIFDVAEKFVNQQTAMYKFGLHQFNIDADWTKWREFKMSHGESTERLQEWYNNCFADGKIKKPLDYSKETYDKALE